MVGRGLVLLTPSPRVSIYNQLFSTLSPERQARVAAASDGVPGGGAGSGGDQHNGVFAGGSGADLYIPTWRTWRTSRHSRRARTRRPRRRRYTEMKNAAAAGPRRQAPGGATVDSAVHVSNFGKGRLGLKCLMCLALGVWKWATWLVSYQPEGPRGARGCSCSRLGAKRCEVPLGSSGLQSCLVRVSYPGFRFSTIWVTSEAAFLCGLLFLLSIFRYRFSVFGVRHFNSPA